MGLLLRVMVFGVLTACGAWAQEPSGALPDAYAPVLGELEAMAAQAGVIFAGQVLAVRPQPALGWIEVEFQVEQAVRGCVGAGTYTLREWTGLWTGGVERYRVGQRLLLLLHAPGAAGMSSPVGGQDGVIPIVGAGVKAGVDDRALDRAVDLRWLETHLVRQSGGRLHLQPVGFDRAARGVRSNARFEAGRMQGAGFTASRLHAEQSMTPAGSPAQAEGLSQGLTLRSVLAIMRAWEAHRANAGR